MDRDTPVNVNSIGAIDMLAHQAPLPQEGHQRIREQDVNVGGQDELSLRPTDTSVLSDHLEQREPVTVRERAMDRRLDGDDAYRAPALIVWPGQGISQGRTVWRRVPLNENQFRRNGMAYRLRNQGAHEDLHSGQQVFAVVVIPGGGDHGQIGVALSLIHCTQPIGQQSLR
jgi:hypothetical protein